MLIRSGFERAWNPKTVAKRYGLAAGSAPGHLCAGCDLKGGQCGGKCGSTSPRLGGKVPTSIAEWVAYVPSYYTAPGTSTVPGATIDTATGLTPNQIAQYKQNAVDAMKGAGGGGGTTTIFTQAQLPTQTTTSGQGTNVDSPGSQAGSASSQTPDATGQLMALLSSFAGGNAPAGGAPVAMGETLPAETPTDWFSQYKWYLLGGAAALFLLKFYQIKSHGKRR